MIKFARKYNRRNSHKRSPCVCVCVPAKRHIMQAQSLGRGNLQRPFAKLRRRGSQARGRATCIYTPLEQRCTADTGVKIRSSFAPALCTHYVIRAPGEVAHSPITRARFCASASQGLEDRKAEWRRGTFAQVYTRIIRANDRPPPIMQANYPIEAFSQKVRKPIRKNYSLFGK